MLSSLVLAIEPDARQAAILRRVVRERTHADIVVVDSKDAAIAAIAARVPELILVTALLSPRDEEELVAHLRSLDEADYLQTITIPQLATAGAGGSSDDGSGFFKKTFRRKKFEIGGVGCDPWAFADQVTGYLRAATEARATRLMARAYERAHPSLADADAADADAADAAPAAPTEFPTQPFEPLAPAFEAAAPALEMPAAAPEPPAIPNLAPDVAETHAEHAAPEPASQNPPEQVFTDPDYAFSWRSSTKPPEPAKTHKHKKSDRKDSHRHPAPAPSVLRPEPMAPEPPAPEPVVAPPAPAPAPVVTPAAAAPVVIAPEPVVAVPQPVVAAAAEPMVAPPEPAIVVPEPVVAPPEPAIIVPEPVVAAPPPLVVAPAREPEAPAPIVAKAPKAPRAAARVLQALNKFTRAPETPRAPEPPRAPAIVLRPLKRLPALAMWARLNEAAERIGTAPQVAPPQAPHARHEDDDVAALIGGLRVPAHVLAVSYPRRPYIHRIRSAA